MVRTIIEKNRILYGFVHRKTRLRIQYFSFFQPVTNLFCYRNSSGISVASPLFTISIVWHTTQHQSNHRICCFFFFWHVGRQRYAKKNSASASSSVFDVYLQFPSCMKYDEHKNYVMSLHCKLVLRHRQIFTPQTANELPKKLQEYLTLNLSHSHSLKIRQECSDIRCVDSAAA